MVKFQGLPESEDDKKESVGLLSGEFPLGEPGRSASDSVGVKVAMAFDHNKRADGCFPLRSNVFIKRQRNAFQSGKFLCIA